MSKPNVEHEQAAVAVDELEATESQPLRSISYDRQNEDVQDFVASNGLEQELDVLQKASLLLRHDANEELVPGIAAAEVEALHRETTHKWQQPWTLYLAIFACSLGAIAQGWAQTGMNGANLYIPKAFSIDSGSTHDSIVLGLINCGTYLAQGLIGAWSSDSINTRIGRRGAIFCGTALCLVGNLGSAISWSWLVLLFFRLVLGTGLGLNSSTVSVYAAECAPAYIRGGLAVSWQLFTALGIFIGFAANVAFYNLDEDSIWRFQLAAPLLPTVPLLLLIYICPESPAWYMKHKRYDLAFGSLARLRNVRLQAASELYSIFLSSRTNGKRETEKSCMGKLLSIFTIPRNRHAVYASYTVMLAQQLCGINIISFYSSTIFSSSGFSPLAALWASVVFGLVNFLGALPAIWTMDSFGRRGLLLWTLPPMAITMLLTGLSYSLPKGTVQFSILAGLIYLFCLLYSPGVGPVPCAYSAEVYPLDVREIGMSFAISTTTLWATVLSLTFPTLLAILGEQGSFVLYAVLNVVAWVLCWTFVRETRAVRLEEMDAVFESSAAHFVEERWSEGVWRWTGSGKLHKGWQQIEQEDLDDR